MLKKIVLCKNNPSERRTSPFPNYLSFRPQRKGRMASKVFTLAVLFLACSMVVAQGVDTKGDGNQSGPTFTVTDCTSDGEICGGIIKRFAPLNIPGVPVGATMVAGGGPNLSGNIDAAQGGQDAGSGTTSAMLGALVGMYIGWSKQGLRNGWDNFTHAEEGHLAPLQYFMGGPGDVEEGGAALGSGMRFGGPNGGGGGGWGRGWGYKTPALSALKNKAFYVGSFNDNLSLWEMQNFGSQWGVNAGIPGRHLLGLVDRIGLGLKGPGYGAAVERINQAFWQEGLSIQNAIRREPKILALFQAEAEQDISFHIELGVSDYEQKEAFKHYERTGLHAFDNP